MSDWPTPLVLARGEDLKDTIGELANVKRGSGFIEACLARYLVVRAAGYVEATRDSAIDYFVSKNSHVAVANRVRQELKKGTGAQPDYLFKQLLAFDRTWADALKAFLATGDPKLSNELGALVAARKLIAHGEGERVDRDAALRWGTAALHVGGWFIDVFALDLIGPASVQRSELT